VTSEPADRRSSADPCARPECGGEQHTDLWGTPVQCPHAEPVLEDTGRRCPRCDCPDGHEQCQHCKVCPHAGQPHVEALGPDGLTAAERQRKHIRAELQRQMPGLEAERLWQITLAVQRAAHGQQETP
jgi:hypothetical protein